MRKKLLFKGFGVTLTVRQFQGKQFDQPDTDFDKSPLKYTSLQELGTL